MDLEEFDAKPTSTAMSLAQEDLSTFSLEDLEERIKLLEAEIERCKAARGSKESSLAEANRFFKS